MRKYTVEQIMANEWSVVKMPTEKRPVTTIRMADGLDVKFEYNEMFDEWEYLEGRDGRAKRDLVYAVCDAERFYEKFYALFGIEI